MKIILISGKAQHGKDTLAAILKSQLMDLGVEPTRVLITHYGDLLKWVAQKYFQWNGKKDDAGRALLQEIGTEKMREKYPDFWVDTCLMILDAYAENWDYVLIPDTRFPNEVLRPRTGSHPVVLIRIERPNFDNGLTAEQKQHISETALDDWQPQYHVSNDGTLEDLQKTAEQIAQLLR